MTMTPQIIFDQAVEHLFKQGGPSIDFFSGACLYRHPSTGRKCVVGFFIPDESYHATMDKGPQGNSLDVYCLVNSFSTDVPSWFEDHTPLLASLQVAHDAEECRSATEDGGWNVPALRDFLLDIASEHALDPSAVDRFFPMR